MAKRAPCWTPEEEELIVQGLPVPGRSLSACRTRRYTLRQRGITCKSIRYDALEDIVVEERIPGVTLPTRDSQSMNGRACYRRLVKGEDIAYLVRPFFLPECEFILDNDDLSNPELGELLNRDRSVILRKRADLYDRVAKGLPLIGRRRRQAGA